MKPRVTVLMTVYRGLPYLQEAIESVLSQSFSDFEFIIIDDASTDGSAEVVETYKDLRIRFLRNSSNIGQYRTINLGLAEAEGDIVVLLDQDDVCLPDRIARQVGYLDENPDVAVVGTWAYSIDDRSRRKNSWRWRVADFGVLSGLLLLARCPLIHSSVAYRRSTILSLGGYDPGFGTASDYALWTTLAVAGHRAALIPEYLIMFRKHSGQQSANVGVHSKDVARAHESFVSHLSGLADVGAIASVLRIESTIWTENLGRERIVSILESIDDLLSRSEGIFRFRSNESRHMRRTVYRWLGPGAKLASRMKGWPDLMFYPLIYASSPLLVPGVRPLAVRVLRSLRGLSTLVRRVNH